MSNQEITTRVLTSLDEMAQFREPWNSLCEKRLFHSWEWMYSWWETYQQTGDLAVIVVIDQTGRWVGIAPWFKTASASRGRVVRSLGSGAACSDYVSLAVKPGFESIVVDAVIDQMFGHDQHELFENVDLFEFEGHLASDLVMQLLLDRIPGELAGSLTEEIGGTWRTAMPESWEEFEKGLKKSFRRKTKKAAKRLASEEFQGEVYWSPEDIASNWPVFVDLHQRRRNSLGQQGCFADPQFESFLKLATIRLAGRAKAQINMIYHHDKPLTCNLEFTSADSIYMYQTGMDPDRLELEPGHITFTWAIRETIDRQFTWFDFLRGDEPYKRFWNSERIGLLRTRIVPNRFSSALRFSITSAGKQIRGWARNVKGHFEK